MADLIPEDDSMEEEQQDIDGLVLMVAQMLEECPVIAMVRFDGTIVVGVVYELNEDAIGYHAVDTDNDIEVQRRVTRWEIISEVLQGDECKRLYGLIQQRRNFAKLFKKRGPRKGKETKSK